jgi:hypothetical protein
MFPAVGRFPIFSGKEKERDHEESSDHPVAVILGAIIVGSMGTGLKLLNVFAFFLGMCRPAAPGAPQG